MTRSNILPGLRAVTFSHGHAHMSRDGEPFANLSLGREGRELHSEGIHFMLEGDARAIAALPNLLNALEIIHANAAESPEWIRRHTVTALTAAGYQF